MLLRLRLLGEIAATGRPRNFCRTIPYTERSRTRYGNESLRAPRRGFHSEPANRRPRIRVNNARAPGL